MVDFAKLLEKSREEKRRKGDMAKGKSTVDAADTADTAEVDLAGAVTASRAAREVEVRDKIAEEIKNVSEQDLDIATAIVTARVEIEVPPAPPAPAPPTKKQSLSEFLASQQKDKSPTIAPAAANPLATLSVGSAMAISQTLASPAGQAALAESSTAAPAIAPQPGLSASGMRLPAGLTLFNTRDLHTGYLHCLLYGETDARKSTTAAQFGTPENTRIILCRRPEQLIPLRTLGYQAAHVEDVEALKYCLLYPHEIWPDWAKMKDRTLVLDDFTRAKDMMLDASEMKAVTDASGNVTGYKEVRDARQVHKAAKDEMYDVMQVVFKQPQHFIGTALAQIYDNKITHEETLSPDIPPSMGRMIMTEFEFVFFIDKKTWRFVTTQKLEAYAEKDDKGRTVTHNRSIFAKRKLPVELENKNLIWQDEDMNLREIWERVQTGKKK